MCVGADMMHNTSKSIIYFLQKGLESVKIKKGY